MADIGWIFDEIPRSGATSKINADEQAFDSNMEQFVRETIQNSNDAIVDMPGEVHFTLEDLTGRKLDEFQDGIRWQRTLSAHIEAVADEGNTSFRDFLDRDGEGMRIMRIEDRGCAGLKGEEDENDSNYYGLVKGEGYTNKGRESSGGTYGLGKAVQTKFSRINTVIFNSLPEGADGGPRTIARSRLTYHELDGEQYHGRGFMGEITEHNGVERAESVWGSDASNLAEKLRAQHSTDRPGTTITIPAFGDPTEKKRDREDVMDDIRRSAVKFFYPAMESQEDRLNVFVDDENDPLSAEDVRNLGDQSLDVTPFVEIYRAYEEGNISEEGFKKGEVVSRDIEVKLPKHREKGPREDANATLLIKKAEQPRGKDLINHVAAFRGPKMVVKYKNKETVAYTGDNFYAVLVCGEAKKNPETSDEHLDEFLKNAEPPSHDKWTSTEKLRNTYQTPYKKPLDNLWDDVSQNLRDVVIEGTEEGESGARKLGSLFPVSTGSEGETPSKSYFNIDLQGYTKESFWKFDGQVEHTRSGNWELNLRAEMVDESGSGTEQLRIENVEIAGEDYGGGEEVTRKDIEAEEIKFEVETEELDDILLSNGAVKLLVDAEEVGNDD